MGELVDLSLFAPDWMFDSERFAQFISVIQTMTESALTEIDEIQWLTNLQQLINENQWINEYIQQIGMDFGFNIQQLQDIAGIAAALIRRIGTYEGFNFLANQIYGRGIQLQDNFQNVLVLSSQNAPSSGFLQDGDFYRDGSWSVYFPYYFYNQYFMNTVASWFPVGIFLWYFATSFIFMLQDNNTVSSFIASNSLPQLLESEDVVDIGGESVQDYLTADSDNIAEFDTQDYCIIVNQKRSVMQPVLVMAPRVIINDYIGVINNTAVMKYECDYTSQGAINTQRIAMFMNDYLGVINPFSKVVILQSYPVNFVKVKLGMINKNVIFDITGGNIIQSGIILSINNGQGIINPQAVTVSGKRGIVNNNIAIMYKSSGMIV